MIEQDWLYGLLGGIFIGLAGSMYLLVNGKIMGASSIIGGIIHKSKENDYLEKNVPFGKWITPQDIGSALEFIFSNKQLTANRLIIDGGQHLSSPN